MYIYIFLKKELHVQLAQYELMDQLNHFGNSQHSDLRF